MLPEGGKEKRAHRATHSRSSFKFSRLHICAAFWCLLLYNRIIVSEVNEWVFACKSLMHSIFSNTCDMWMWWIFWISFTLNKGRNVARLDMYCVIESKSAHEHKHLHRESWYEPKITMRNRLRLWTWPTQHRCLLSLVKIFDFRLLQSASFTLVFLQLSCCCCACYFAKNSRDGKN